MLPLVIFLDIDGTIIGDILPQVCEWEILENYDRAKIPAFRQNLVEMLQCGILRENLADFLTMMKKTHDHIEFFIYTASDMKWAQFLVPCIEKAIGFQFNRPIFSRKHCISKTAEYKKSLSSVLPFVTKRLSPKYKLMNTKSMRNRVAIVDNNNVLVNGEMHRCIKCPTYDYTYHYDILARLSLKVLGSHYGEIASILSRHQLFPEFYVSSNNHMTFTTFRVKYYEALCGAIMSSAKQNKKAVRQDKYWIELLNIMQTANIESLKENVVYTLNKALHKRRIQCDV